MCTTFNFIAIIIIIIIIAVSSAVVAMLGAMFVARGNWSCLKADWDRPMGYGNSYRFFCALTLLYGNPPVFANPVDTSHENIRTFDVFPQPSDTPWTFYYP